MSVVGICDIARQKLAAKEFRTKFKNAVESEQYNAILKGICPFCGDDLEIVETCPVLERYAGKGRIVNAAVKMLDFCALLTWYTFYICQKHGTVHSFKHDLSH